MTSANDSYRPPGQGGSNAYGSGGYAGRPHHQYSQQQQRQQKARPFSAFDALSRDGIADIITTGSHRKLDDPFNPDDSDEGIDDAGMESDDPTNTAMFLDDSEEKELHGVPPGTPQAFKKLGQLTVKSISRQKDSQTPGRTQTRASVISQLGKSGSAGRNSRGGSILPLQFGVPGSQHHRVNLDPEFDKNEFSPIVFSKQRKAERQSATAPKLEDLAREMPALDEEEEVEQKTPETKPRMPTVGTPYNLLRALSERSNESRLAERPPAPPSIDADGGYLQLKQLPSNALMKTPEKQPTLNLLGDTPPPSLSRERLDSLRKFFREQSSAMQGPSETGSGKAKVVTTRKDNSNLLISFDTFDHQNQHSNEALAPLSTSTLSQISSIRHSDGTMLNFLNSPSPLRPLKLPADGLCSPPLLGDDSDSLLSLLPDASSRGRDQDLSKPVPYLLNQIWKQQEEHRERQAAGSSGNLIDLSSRLNMSIHALNNGLRGQLMQSGGGTASVDQDELDFVTRAVEMVGTELNQSLASLRPGPNNNRDDLSPGRHGLSTIAESELEDQVKTLRETMLETKDIVFTIQRELDQQKQGQSSDDSKLDDIVRLLGALDMRLHMLEGRQRLDQAPQRSNLGSVKVYAGNGPQQQDIISRIGQCIAYCLGRYPLMLLGALFIILLSELLVIGGFGSSVQTVRVLGRHAFDEMKRHIAVEPHLPS
ncbi:hypothetical protein IWW37_004633 [Coemansia sp. RSA 2050]|nr:hypothetical protein IWW37_004633 [Coemansia sp. RSA 2050]